ncbi:tetratricopeptide repeat protein [Xanthomonas oryzae]|nr:tetratricopeptide repeat protein [Xanthomonas oryzae]
MRRHATTSSPHFTTVSARWLETTLKIDPSRAVAYLNLGDAYAKAGDREKARKAYSTYLELQPQGSGAAQARAQLQSL